MCTLEVAMQCHQEQRRLAQWAEPRLQASIVKQDL